MSEAEMRILKWISGYMIQNPGFFFVTDDNYFELDIHY